MDGHVMIAVGLLGQMLPLAYSSFVEAEKREADPAFFQTYSVSSTSNNFDCKHGGCGGGIYELGKSESSPPQCLGCYQNGKREASPGQVKVKREALPCYERECEGHGHGKRAASPEHGNVKREALPCYGIEFEGHCHGKREASPGHGIEKREALPCYGRQCKREASPDHGYIKREASPQFTQKFNDRATFQNFDCNPSTGCREVGSNIPSPGSNNPVTSLPQRVTSPPRKVETSLPTRVENPTRKVVSNQQPSSTSRPTVTKSPQRVIVDYYQPAADECKCDVSQMVVFVGYDNYRCSSISTTKDGSVCFYKNSSDEDRSCNCG